MMRRKQWPAIMTVVLAALAIVGVLGAAPAGSQGADDGNRLEVNQLDATNAPSMTAVVTAPASALGIDPSALRFIVNEDGEPIDVTVTALEGRNLEVVLLVDTSGSMRGEAMDAARAAALEFLDIMPPAVPISVRGFGARAADATEFTTDREVLATAVQALSPSGETALYDALSATAADFSERDADRSVAVVVTDGGDTVSAATSDEAIAALEAANVEVNAVSLITSESDPFTLAEIVLARNGTVVSATDPVGLSEAYGQVAALLVNRFALEWSTASGGPTEIELGLLAPDGWYRFSTQVALPNLVAPKASPQITPPSSVEVIPRPDQNAVLSLVPESSTERLFVIGLGLVFIALLVAIATFVLVPPSDRKLSKEFMAFQTNQRSLPGSDLSAPMRRIAQWFDQRFQRASSYDRLNLMLDRAAVRSSAAEVAAGLFASSLVAVFLGIALGSVVFGLLLAALILGGAWIFLKLRSRKRQEAFAEQLDTTLVMIAGTLRAGYGINQAIDTVAMEADAPTNEEFQRVLTEVRLGKSLPDALRSAALRVDSEDFEWVVQAIEINTEVGGNLAEVLENVAGTMRARTTVKRKVRALSAEGRISAMVLYALPFLMLAWIRIANPQYLAEMTGSSAGLIMFMVCGFLLAVGGLWLRRIVTIDF